MKKSGCFHFCNPEINGGDVILSLPSFPGGALQTDDMGSHGPGASGSS